MYPVSHMTIAVGAIGFGGRWLRRSRGPDATFPALDYRFVALGSQIPDLIDKPIKWYIFPGSADDAHIYGHTLVLSGCIILAGMLLTRTGDFRLLALGVGSFTHPLVDPTNTYPQTLFWPLFGWHFPVAHQDYRTYFQVPLDIVLIMTYGALVWRSDKWRARALAFARSGAFPFADAEAASGLPRVPRISDQRHDPSM